MLPEKYNVHLEYSSMKSFLPPAWPTIENLKKASKETLEHWLNIPANPKVIELCSKDLQWKHSRPWDKFLPEIFNKNELYVDSPVHVGPKFFQNKLHSSVMSTIKCRIKPA